MEMELNDRDLAILLTVIGQKLSDAEDPQFGKCVCSVASFATKLIATVVIGIADSREEALDGVRSALADCEQLVNKSYDVLEALGEIRNAKIN